MAIDIEATWQRLSEAERSYIDFLAPLAAQGDVFSQRKLLDYYDEDSIGKILARLCYGVHIQDPFAILRLGQQYTIQRPRISGKPQLFDQDFEEAKRLLKIASESPVPVVAEQAGHCFKAIFHRFSREFDPGSLADSLGTLVTGIVADGPSAYTVKKYVGTSLEPHVPAGIETIAWDAFRKTRIRKVHLPFSLRVIQQSAFSDCTELTEVVLPRYVHTVASFAFYGCTKMKELHLSASMHTVDSHSFKNCTSLDFVRIPGNIRTIGREAFAGSGLKTLILDEGVETICQGAFRDTPLTTVYLPQSLRNIEKNAFAGCSQLKVCYADSCFLFPRFDTFGKGNEALAKGFSYNLDAAFDHYRLNEA